ncbi:ethanolamine utilization microcompartment protein EutK [Entomohabitans teleogrylli]|uniref:ethanolamine utilization microcompartment protein EutK n=1 Tax=Entomohabitans teleogrylli TaxID=1384589 RepID=UPI00073D50ED|nr:ethanolamine utilization microcompartment protein EutK [Entomohabitans teleogrylli]
MINALGLLEVSGMAAGIDAADAMLKAASVRLLSHQVLDPGKVTLVVEGDLAACRAALDAGAAAASRSGTVISRKEIGRPDPDTERLVDGFRPRSDGAAPATFDDAPLLEALGAQRQGMTSGEVSASFGWPLEQARIRLEQLWQQGKVQKRGSRYRRKKT